MFSGSKLFQNKYRIQSIRMRGWDYGGCGEYFITICTKNKKHYFGEVVDEKMRLNELGRIIKEEWIKTAKIRLNVVLDKFVIMPNHFHGIIFINDDVPNLQNYIRYKLNLFTPILNLQLNVFRRDEASPRLYDCNQNLFKTKYKLRISPKPNSLSSIIGSFKSACTKRIRKIQPDFTWQPRFYDRIIRNEKEYFDTQQYILDNPGRWGKEKAIS